MTERVTKNEIFLINWAPCCHRKEFGAKSSLIHAQQHESKIHLLPRHSTLGIRSVVQEKCQNAISGEDRAPKCLPSSAIVARGAIREFKSRTRGVGFIYKRREREMMTPRVNIQKQLNPFASRRNTYILIQQRAGGRPTNQLFYIYNIHPEEIKLWVCGGAAALTDCVLRSEVRPTCQGLRWVRDAIDISSRAPATAKCSVTHFN